MKIKTIDDSKLSDGPEHTWENAKYCQLDVFKLQDKFMITGNSIWMDYL